jgi:hypothetical protein
MHKPIFYVVTLWLTPVIAVGLYGLSVPIAVALIVALAVAAGVGLRVAEPLAATLQPAGTSRALMLAIAVVTLIALVQIARLSVFMGNVARIDLSIDPSSTWRIQHCCLTSYAEGARMAAGGTDNIYDPAFYEPRFLHRLKVDPYHYPPPFLLVPRALQAATADFLRLRALWFSMQALALGIVAIAVPWWIGGRPGAYALAGAVFFLATPQSLFSLQQGNFQTTAFATAIGTFVLLSTRYPGVAATLLAYVSLSKIFPGILVVYLAAARRWREVAWVGGSAIGLVLLAAAAFGTRPFADFIFYQVPRISNGGAFPQAETFAIFQNQSVYGLTVRLRSLGLGWLDMATGLRIASLYGVVVVALAAYAGWKYQVDLTRPAARLQIAQLALGLVVLASFRSPFVGGYGLVGAVWLLTLLAAHAESSRSLLMWFGAIAALCAVLESLPRPDQPMLLAAKIVSTVSFSAVLGISFWAVLGVLARARRAAVTHYQAIP